MAWPRRQLAVAHRPQLATERLLRHADLVFVPDPLAEIDDAPADHAVHGRDRALGDHLCKRSTMLVAQSRWLPGRLAVDQPLRAVRVEPQHPIPHHLQGHAAHLGRLRPAASVIDHRQRQEPPNLIGILALPGNSVQSRRIIIRPQRDRLPHDEPPLFATQENQITPASGNQNEITPAPGNPSMSRGQRNLVLRDLCAEGFGATRR